MNGEERQLITGLFDRMRGFGRVEKDREADALIGDLMRQTPDAGYLMVQSVLVQEQALQNAGARIEQLEARVRELEARGQPQSSQGGGSFLGGLFGGGRTSVPSAGNQSAGFSGRPASTYSSSSPGFGQQAPGYGQQPMAPQGSPWGQPQMGQAPMQPPQRGGGGFMSSALTTAAGVAGGMLLANSISSMFGGQHGAAHASPSPIPDQSASPAAIEPPADQYASNEDDEAQDAAQDAAWDDNSGGDFGGGDDSMDV